MRPYSQPSGYTGTEPRGGETDSNGLIVDAQGRLVLCQHGDRRLARMDAPLDNPKPQFTTLADRFEGKRLNSPNDAVFRRNGDPYFTDSAYGWRSSGTTRTRDSVRGRLPPRGLRRSHADDEGHDAPERSRVLGGRETHLRRAVRSEVGDIRVFDMKGDGTFGDGRLLLDVTAMVGPARPGLPDGLKIDTEGNLFATGPAACW